MGLDYPALCVNIIQRAGESDQSVFTAPKVERTKKRIVSRFFGRISNRESQIEVLDWAGYKRCKLQLENSQFELESAL